MKKITVLLFLVVVGVLLFFALGRLRQTPQGEKIFPEKSNPPLVSTTPSPQISPSDSPLCPLSCYPWQPGDHLRFQLHYQSNVTQKLDSNHLAFAFDITGELHQRIYKVLQDELWAGYQVEKPSVKISQARPQDIQMFEEALAQEVYVNLNKQGLIRTWYFPQNMRPELRNNIKSILLTSQVLLPDKPVSDWTSLESDLNGQYRAGYNVEKLSASGMLLKKEKLAYTEPDKKDFLKIVSSSANVNLDARGYLVDIDLTERFRADVMNCVSEGNIVLSLVCKAQTNEPQLALAWDDKKLKGESIYSTTSAVGEGGEEFRLQRLRRILGNTNWQQLAQELERLKERDNSAQRFELFRKLVALMELQPEQINVVVQQILHEKEADLNVATLVNALAKVNNPLAQQALAEILEKSQENPEIMRIAIDSLGGVEVPTKETVDLLQRIYRNSGAGEIHNAASLALGTMASHLQKANDPQADGIAFDLGRELVRSTTIENKIVILEALGNAANSAALPHIKAFLDTPQEQVRATAMIALRSIPDPRVDTLLAEALAKEKSFVVRNQTLDAMGYRAPTKEIFAALSQSVDKEISIELRIKQAKLLWKMRDQFPQAESIVKKLATEDASSKVRDALQGFMLVD